MRNDERYNPKPQSGQLEIFGLGAKGEADAEDARRWIDENPGAWNYMVENAVRLSKKGYVSVRNGLAPSFARIMEARYPSLKDAFNKHRSQSDGFTA